MNHGDAPRSGRWDGFWAQMRRDYASWWPQLRADWERLRERSRETTAEIRQMRQLDRGMRQRITGLDSPARRDVRRVIRQIGPEHDKRK